MAKPSQPVTIRIASEFLKQLKDEAERDGCNLSDSARRHLLRSLTGSDSAELRSELEEFRAEFRAENKKLHDALKKMRGDLATLGAHLLIKVAQDDEAEAEAWVREHLAP